MKNIILLLLLLVEVAHAANPAVIFGSGDRGLIMPKNGLDFQGGSTLSGSEVIGLKNTMSTGVSNGGGSLSIGAPTSTVSISAGVGYVVDNTTNPDVPVVTKVNFGPFVNVPVTFIGVAPITIFYVNSAGALEQETALPASAKFRDKILLGVAVHQDLATVSDVIDTKVPMNDVALSVKDMADAIGLINTTGNIFSAGGADLTLQKNAGTTFQYGGNATLDPKTPHTNTDIALIPVTTFVYNHRDGIGGYTEITSSVVDPGFYDDGSGTLASVPANRYTIQRIYYRPSLGTIDVVYGFELHATLAGAEAAIFGEVTDINPLVSSGTTLRAWLVVKGPTTDLQDIADAKFISAGRFGDTIGGGSTSATTTLQVAYNNSVQPQFVLDATRMGIEILDALTPIGTKLFELWDNAKTTSFFAVDALWAYVQGDPIVVIDSTATNGEVPYTSVFNGAKKHNFSTVERLNEQVKDNLIVNPSYENIGGVGVINIITGIDISGTTSRTLQSSAHNAIQFQIEAIGAYTFDYTRAVTGDFTGRQMVGYCEIRTASEDVKFTIGTHELSVSSDDTWRYYKIPFQGSVDPEIVISNAVSGTDIVRVDNCFLGVSDNEVQEVGTAHFVGSLTQTDTANCQWTTTSGGFASFAADADCTGYQAVGSVQSPDTLIPAVKIPNARTDGYYQVDMTGWIYAATGGAPTIRLSDGTSSGGVVGFQDAAIDQMINYTSHQFRFPSTGDRTVEIQGLIEAGGTLNIYANTIKRALQFNVYFYPDSTSTIATQNTTTDFAVIEEWKTYTPITNGIGTPSFNTVLYRRVGDSLQFQASITTGATTPDELQVGLPSGLVIDSEIAPTQIVGAIQPSLGNNETHFTVLATAGDTYFNVGARSAGANNATSPQNGNGLFSSSTATYWNATVKIEGWNATEAKQATIVGSFEQIENVTDDLTALTANTFTAFVANTGAVFSDSYDFINGDCVTSGTNNSTKTCTLNDLAITTGLICTGNSTTGVSNSDTLGDFDGSTNTFSFVTYRNNTLYQFTDSFITCHKREQDLNKSFVGAIINASTAQAEIVEAVLENTASDDLISIQLAKADSQTFTGVSSPIKYNTVLNSSNTGGHYDILTGIFTAPRAGEFQFCPKMLWVQATWPVGSLDEMSISGYVLDRNERVTTNIDYYPVGKCHTLKMTALQTTSVNILQTTGLDKANLGSSAYNTLSIQEMPTTQSIVANLLADSGMIETCTTKTLSGDVNSVGNIADLTMNNLTIGKKYELSLSLDISAIGGGNQYAFIRIDNGGYKYRPKWQANTAPLTMRSNISFNKIITATDPTVYINVETINNDTYITSGATQSYFQLCELPETTLLTTEFN